MQKQIQHIAGTFCRLFHGFAFLVLPLLGMTAIGHGQTLVRSAPYTSQPYAFTKSNTLLLATATDSAANYKGLLFNVRYNPFQSDAGQVTMRYTDESPSRDTFSSTKSIQASDYDLGFDVGLEWGNKRGRHGEILLGGMSKDPLRRFYAQFGWGYNFSLVRRNWLVVRPVINLSYGNVRYELGDMYQNATYIQVNSQKFYSEKVRVSVRANPLVVLPRLDLVASVGKRLMIRAQCGYHFTALQSKPKVRFDGRDENDEPLVAREDITASNVDLRVNGQKIQKIPVTLDGLFASAGITYVFR